MTDADRRDASDDPPEESVTATDDGAVDRPWAGISRRTAVAMVVLTGGATVANAYELLAGGGGTWALVSVVIFGATTLVFAAQAVGAR